MAAYNWPPDIAVTFPQFRGLTSNFMILPLVDVSMKSGEGHIYDLRDAVRDVAYLGIGVRARRPCTAGRAGIRLLFNPGKQPCLQRVVVDLIGGDLPRRPREIEE